MLVKATVRVQNRQNIYRIFILGCKSKLFQDKSKEVAEKIVEEKQDSTEPVKMKSTEIEKTESSEPVKVKKVKSKVIICYKSVFFFDFNKGHS